MARKRKRRGSVRTGSKRLEGRLLDNARYLRDHPEAAVPQCQGRCPLLCPFRRARKAVARVHAGRDNAARLRRYSRHGHPLGRAYAAALRLALVGDEGIEYLQNVRTPAGTVPVVPWGKAPLLCHAGMQHRHDPQVRLLLAVPFLRGRDAVFAAEEGLVCAHDGAPPAATLEALLSQLPVASASASVARCPHIGDDAIAVAYLELAWSTAGVRIRVCEACATGNTLGVVQRHFAARSVLDLVTLSVKLPRLSDPTGGDVPDAAAPPPASLLKQYARGEVDDRRLIAEARSSRALGLAKLSDPFVVVDRTVHRPPFGTLLDALDPPEPLRSMLVAALSHLGRPVVLDKGTGVELLHALWAESGERALADVLGPDGGALFVAEATPADLERLLPRAARLVSERRVADELPAYARVPAPADLADRVARALLSGGRAQAQQVLAAAPRAAHTMLAYALVHALDLPRPSWTVDPRDREFAAHLEPLARALFSARGEAYHEALLALVQATGTTEPLVRA